VKFADKVGMQLIERDQGTNKIQPTGTYQLEEYEILNIFPFSSEAKRMGIVVRLKETG
jgi:phospholipid-translocating ATPase